VSKLPFPILTIAHLLLLVTGLTTLRLWGVLCKITSDAVFASLVELGLFDIAWTSTIEEILSPTIFPCLKALAWLALEFSSDITTALLSLSEQLEVLLSDVDDVRDWPPELRRCLEDKTLFDLPFIDLGDLQLPPVQFVRLYDLNGDGLGSHEELLETYAALVEAADENAHPSLIYLPSQLEAAYFEEGSADVEGLSFKTECEKKKIEVRFEEEVGDRKFDSAISDDFWRLIKKRKIEARRE
jgi:hypothetical protein